MDNLISLVEKKNFTLALKTLETNADIFKNISASRRENMLDTMNFHTYSFIIQGLLEDIKPCQETAFIFNRFLREFDYDHIKHRFKQFCDLVKKQVNFFVEVKLGIKIVRGLQIALGKISSQEDGLTPLHTLYVKLCIQTKTYKEAIPVLQRAITCFHKNSEMSEEEITSYFYYGGHVMIALKQYEEAYLMFRFCLQLTHNYIYSSSLNAKKKLILLVLHNPKLSYITSEKKFKINDGFLTRYLDFSRNLGADDVEVLNIFTKVYMDLINEEKLGTSTEEFQKYLQENTEVFEEDKTLGLMKELLPSFHLRKLKQLKRIYQNYPANEVAKILEVKDLVPALVRAFAIKPIGRIDVKNNAIVFVKAKDPYRLNSLNRVYNLTNLLKQVSQEYNKEHETIIRDRISMPNTIFS